MGDDLEKPLMAGAEANKEKEHVTLPPWSNADLTDVVLYEGKASPPCCKIRAVLNYYRIPFERKEGKKPDSTYKKVPVLMLNGRQLNDSFVMVKALAPVLMGEQLSPELVDLEFITTYHLMLSMEADTVDSCNDLCLCSSFLGGCMGLGLCILSPCLPACGVSDTIRAKTEDILSVEECVQKVLDRLEGKTFLHGDKPGIVDVSLFGMLEPFVQSKCSAGQKVLSLGLANWHARMAQLVPSIWDYEDYQDSC